MGAPSVSGREGGGGGGGGQDRTRGCHLTAVNMLSAFGRFNQWGEGGGCCPLSANLIIQSVGGGCCPLSANSASGECACM